jgi:hypothetical protein
MALARAMTDQGFTNQPVPVEGDKLLDELDSTIRLVIGLDLPGLTEHEREVVVGHLTGAIFVTLPRGLWQ